MPVLTIVGVPPAEVFKEEFHPLKWKELTEEARYAHEKSLYVLMALMKEYVASVDALKITREDVSVYFPPDYVVVDRGEELIVFVDGLYEKPERTPTVLKKLGDVICKTLREWTKENLKQCKQIEVFIRPVNQALGQVATWRA